MVQEAQALEINKPVQTMAQLHPSCVVLNKSPSPLPASVSSSTKCVLTLPLSYDKGA